MSDRITIAYGQTWNDKLIYLMKVEDAVLRSLSTDGLLEQWIPYCVNMSSRYYPSVAKIRAACKIARNNPAGAVLERRDGKWEVMEIAGEGQS